MIYRRKSVLKFGVCVYLVVLVEASPPLPKCSDEVMFSIETALEEGNVLAILITLILNNLPVGIKNLIHNTVALLPHGMCSREL